MFSLLIEALYSFLTVEVLIFCSFALSFVTVACIFRSNQYFTPLFALVYTLDIVGTGTYLVGLARVLAHCYTLAGLNVLFSSPVALGFGGVHPTAPPCCPPCLCVSVCSLSKCGLGEFL